MSFTIRSGFDQVDQLAAEAEARKAASQRGLFRFFMKQGEEKKVIFLTNKPPVIKEHNIKLNGKWGNHFTCLAQMGQTCPLCESGDRPSDVGLFVIIDRSEFTDKNGQKRADSIKLFPAKLQVLQTLKKFDLKYASSGGLVGKEFEVSRSGDKSPSTGGTFIPDGSYDEKELLAIINAQRAKVTLQDGTKLKPIAAISEVVPKWEEVLAPKSEAALRALLGQKVDEPDVEDEAEVNFDD